MTCCNNFVRSCAIWLATLYILLGLAFVGYGLYVVFLPWGEANRQSYLAMGITLTLFGASLTCISWFGYLGAEYQLKKIGNGRTGRSAIGIYLIYLVLLLGALIAAYFYGNEYWNHIKDISDQLKADPNSSHSYSHLEDSLRLYFDSLFFHVRTHCNGEFAWFWKYIEEYCPSQLHQTTCEQCHSYSVSLCGADEDACYGSSDPGDNYACPYATCRQKTLNFVYTTSSLYFNYIMYALGGTTALQIILNLMLAFYPRTKEMAVTVVDGPEEDDGVDELIAAEEAADVGAGQQNSSKSQELNYDNYARVDSIPPPSAPLEGGYGESKTQAPDKSALGTARHKPTAASTYEMNMEIAMMESKQQQQNV